MFPGDDPYCGWYEILPPPEIARSLSGRQSADWVVVGGGFTGLAAARRLAEHHPDARVILLEAQRVGFGASGRNSGFIADIGHHDDAPDLEAHRRLVRLARAGIAELRKAVRANAIDCDWTELGRLHGAVEDSGLRSLERLRERLEELGESYKWLDAAAVARITGTSYYRAAIHTPGTVMVQPAALARGLARTLPPNVELLEQSPIHQVRPGREVELASRAGCVSAKRVLLATNGLMPALGYLKRRIAPVLTFASLTRPLRDEEEAALGGDPVWGLVPEDRLGTSVRRGCRGRILVRNTVFYSPRLQIDDRRRRKIVQAHVNSFRARFPSLGDVPLEYTWGGVVGVSTNHAQFFGPLAPGLFASACYNGVGISIGTISGKLLADLAVGSESQLLREIQDLPKPGWIPPDPLFWFAARAALGILQARAGAEL
jgi:glycine/D-amino acid oxidase-like deaminating enzyme